MKYLRSILFLAGVGCLLLGGFLLAVSASEFTTILLAHETLPPEGMVYVGSDTCYACHSTASPKWNQTLHPRIIQDSLTEPNALVADTSSPGEKVRTVVMGNESRPFTLEDVLYEADTSDHQRYILRTEAGDLLLPDHLHVYERKWVEIIPGAWLKNCAGCHVQKQKL